MRDPDRAFLRDTEVDGLMFIFDDYTQGLRMTGEKILPVLRTLFARDGIRVSSPIGSPRNRTALILIDCQVDFGAPDGEMAKRGADVKPAQAAVKQAEILADAARRAGVAIVFVRLITHPGGENRIAREAKLRHGKDEADLCR